MNVPNNSNPSSLMQFMMWKHYDELGPDDDAYFAWVQDGFDEDGPEYEAPPYIFGDEAGYEEEGTGE